MFFYNGGDQAIDGVISKRADNTVGDDRKSSKTLYTQTQIHSRQPLTYQLSLIARWLLLLNNQHTPG